MVTIADAQVDQIERWPHTYTYSGGLIATDTVTRPDGVQFRKTYTWTASELTSETDWVKL